MSLFNESFLKTFLPDVKFSDFEKQRLGQLLEQKEPKSYIHKFKKLNNYRKSDDLNKTCSYCKNKITKQFYTAKGTKIKIKCSKLGNSNSSKTDVSKFSVCDLFN